MSKKVLLASLMTVGCLVSTASAHYLWVFINQEPGKQATANVYFEEQPNPGDGHYLDPFVQDGKTWVRTVKDLKPQLLPVKEVTAPKQRWLSAPLNQATPRSIDSYGKWGVYTYGDKEILLHYYARAIDVTSHKDLHELARAEQMDLDIVAHAEGHTIQATLLWKGKPAAKRTVYLRGPKGLKQSLTTNDQGRVSFEAEAAGHYTIRSNVEENKQGTDGDKPYDLIRHNATLVLTLPLKD